MADTQAIRSGFPRRPASGSPRSAGRSQQAIPRRGRPQWILLSAVGLVLAWEVLSRSVAAYMADVAPEAALWLNAGQPAALINIADRMLEVSRAAVLSTPGSSDQEAGRREKIRALTESALMREPINAPAARILGQLADAARDDARASQLMEAAVRFSLRETYAAYWMTEEKVARRQYGDALHYADIVLRTRPEFGNDVTQILAKMARDKEGSSQLRAVLAENPPWRRQFFLTIPTSTADMGIPLALLLALRNAPVPPTAAEVNPLLVTLVYKKAFGLAYYAWLQLMPAEQLNNASFLYNGSFESPPSGGPFDWTITQGSGVTIDLVPRPDDRARHALLVEFQLGRVDFHPVAQLVVLAPGAYRLKGTFTGELAGPSGLKWRVTCAGGAAAQAGEGPAITGKAPAWKTFEFSFTVPETDCEAQYVRLELEARSASERLVSGMVLFDDLEIVRAVTPPT